MPSYPCCYTRRFGSFAFLLPKDIYIDHSCCLLNCCAIYILAGRVNIHPGYMSYGVLHRIGMTLRLCKKNRRFFSEIIAKNVYAGR